MIKTLIIDGDGVAINRTKRFGERLAEVYGIQKEVTAPFFNGVFRLCQRGKADMRKELPLYYKDWGWKGTLDELLDFWFRFEGTHNTPMLATIEGIRTAGVLVFLATDNEKYRTEYLMNEFGLGKHFDGVLSSALVGFRKEETEFWSEILKTGKLVPVETLFWDDEKENVEQAARAGFISELFTDMEGFDVKMKIYFPEFL